MLSHRIPGMLAGAIGLLGAAFAAEPAALADDALSLAPAIYRTSPNSENRLAPSGARIEQVHWRGGYGGYGYGGGWGYGGGLGYGYPSYGYGYRPYSGFYRPYPGIYSYSYPAYRYPTYSYPTYGYPLYGYGSYGGCW